MDRERARVALKGQAAMAERIETPEAGRTFRPRVDPDGTRNAEKVPGIWLAPHDNAELKTLVERVKVHNGFTGGHADGYARRLILRAGIAAMRASLDAADELQREAHGTAR